MAIPRPLSIVGRLALGALLGCLALEAGLRAIEWSPLWRVLPVAEASFYVADSATGYAHRPGVRGFHTQENRVRVAISALGLRDRLDRTSAKPAGVERWLVAGDSITEGREVPLEQTFVYLAEAQLADRRIEVVNLALAGARPAVITARLASRAPPLDPDGVVVVVSVGELLDPEPDDAKEFVGYVPGPDGRAVLSHDFRDSRNYRLRMGPWGPWIYAALEHSRLALILNNRKNVGLWAELGQAAPAPAAGSAAADVCNEPFLAKLEALWGPSPPGFSGARLDAFLGDLARLQRKLSAPFVVALRGLGSSCKALEPRHQAVADAVARRLGPMGLGLVDLDGAVARHRPPGTPARALHGFRAQIGLGHLNEVGHRVYAQALTETILAARAAAKAGQAPPSP